MRVTHGHGRALRPAAEFHPREADVTAPPSQDVATDPVARILQVFMGARSAAPAGGGVPGPPYREH
ncbi:hypothetical protein RKD27_004487 [Streptomyces sp. SAI-126]|jgi:hypothetical protein|nr:hypothetical protein [Streptomyces sp. SAI-119]MDH6497799.1 hypothetical protein [Streptomyces sp. SAI-149]GLP65821.1 hypothetical protein TUSST3_24410 [Streptomyces sp. TUS-ST3]